MNTAPQSLDVNVLLEQVAPLRRLARRLVWQDADADDLVQDAALTALQTGARAQQPGAWLRGVVRVLALRRGSTAARHERLEQQLPLPEAAPDPAQVVETLELQRRLATVLIELGEPYRTALHMRYFQDRPPREIASVLGLPLHTVKTHLSRGLDRLRGCLDAEHGGNRRAWQVALTPLAGVRPEALAASTVTSGVVALVGPAKWALLATTLVLIGLSAWLFLGQGEFSDDDAYETGSPPVDATQAADAAEAPRLRGRAPAEAPGASGSAGEARAPIVGDPEADASANADAAATEVAPTPIELLAEVRDGAGNLLPHALVEVYRNRYLGSRKDTRLVHARSDAGGTVHLTVPTPTSDRYRRHVVVAARLDGQAATAREIELRDGVLNRVALSLHEPLELTVKVQDPSGEPVAGASCSACFASMYEYRGPSGEVIAGRTNETGEALLLVPDGDDEGRFSLGGVVGFRVRVRHAGYVDTWSAPIQTAGSRTRTVTIATSPAREVVVRVLSDEDEPRARRPFQVTMRRVTPNGPEPIGRPWSVNTDETGRFRIERAPHDAFVLTLRNSAHAATDVRIERGTAAAHVRMKRLHRGAFSLVDAETKQPVLAQLVTISTYPEGRAVANAARTLGPGRIDVDGLAPGEYMLRAWIVGRWGVHRHRFTMDPRSRNPEAIAIPAPEGRVVEIRTLDADGGPIANATCHLGITGRLDLLRDPPFPIGSCVQARTDAAGRARAVGLPAGGYSLHVRGPDGRTAVVPVAIDESEGAPVTVVVRVEAAAVLHLPVPDEYARAGLAFRPQVIAADGTRHFPPSPAQGDQPGLRTQEVRAGTTTAIPETSDFETVAFPGDLYAVTLDLPAGEARTLSWPALNTVRAMIVVRDEDASVFGGRFCSLLRVGPGQGKEVVRLHRFLGRKQFLFDDEGTHVARGLLPGRYLLVVHGKDYRVHPFDVSSEPEQTVRLPR